MNNQFEDYNAEEGEGGSAGKRKAAIRALRLTILILSLMMILGGMAALLQGNSGGQSAAPSATVSPSSTVSPTATAAATPTPTTAPSANPTPSPASPDDGSDDAEDDSQDDPQDDTQNVQQDDSQAEQLRIAPDGPEVTDHSLDYDYWMLTPAQQLLYEELCEEMNQGKTSIQIMASDASDVGIALEAIGNDRPEYFWFWSWRAQYTSYGESKYMVDLSLLNYCGWPATDIPGMAQLVRQEEQKIISQFQGLSDYEKVKGVYAYLINHSVYDLDYNSQSCYSVLVQGRGVCADYARSMQLLLRALGVQTIHVSNNGHAWNIVKIDGEYYHVDATHGDPVMEDGTQSLNYYYLNLTDEEIQKTSSHQLTDLNHTLPTCEATEYNYYRYEGLMITDTDGSQMTQLIRKAIAEQSNKVTFRAENKKIYNWLMKTYCKGNGTYDALEELGYNTKSLSYSYKEELLMIELDIHLFDD